jgi:hypothetical protein
MCDIQASDVQASDIQATGLNGRHSGQCQGTFRPVKRNYVNVFYEIMNEYTEYEYGNA